MVTVEIGSGYRPGLLGWCVATHARYYAGAWGFGRYFETKVGAEMADFLNRLDEPGNHVFWAADRDAVVASLSLDGGDAEDGLVHLRWFIADDAARGQGIGQRLMARALDVVRDDEAAGIFLTTFAGLDAARRVYDKAGFRLIHEQEDRTWGEPVLEQRFELRF